MTLKDLDLSTRRKYTRMSPTLISAFPNSGKSAAVEFLSDDDKARTILVDTEAKGLPNDFGDEYRTIVRLKPTMISPEKKHLYIDYDNVKYKTLTELQIYLRAALAHEEVDRVVLDSFTALVDQLELHFVTVNSGFTTWANYSKELTEWFSLFKEEARFHGKYLYVLGHYRPSKPDKDGKVDTEAEKFTVVKGTMHYRLVESNFNCVITVEDHKFKADNDNPFDSSRIHKKMSPYESEENSIAEFEQAIVDTLVSA